MLQATGEGEGRSCAARVSQALEDEEGVLNWRECCSPCWCEAASPGSSLMKVAGSEGL